MARNCPTRLAQSAPKSNFSSSANAVASATSAPQLFTAAVLDGVYISKALVVTGSAYSMLSVSTYELLPKLPAI